MTKAQQKEKDEAREYILSIINRLLSENKEPELLIFIKSTSRSGMTRQMIVMLDNINLTWYIQSLLEQSHKTNYVKVGGCGMDMTFWLANRITYELWPFEYKDGKEVFLNTPRPELKGNGGNCLNWRAIY